MESTDPHNPPSSTEVMESPEITATTPASEPVLERLRLRTKTKTVYTPSAPPQAATAFAGKPKANTPPPAPRPPTAPVTPPAKPLSAPDAGAVQAAARSAKITLVIDPASFTSLDSIGKKVMPLEVTVAGQFRLTGAVNSKSYRKVLTQIEELGVENCNLILQGNMSQLGQLESLGMVVQERKVKTAPEAEAPADGDSPAPSSPPPVEAS